ncbi:MAG: hypothetical protein RL108_1535 [Bacteroidota bacterium]|jgi:hypothetical protein
MTKNEFIQLSSLNVGSKIVTNRGSVRELAEFVENQMGFGMRFRGIDSKSGTYNSINKYIYLSEINSLLEYLHLNKKVTFHDVANFVNANTKGGCVTLVTVEIVVNYLKFAIVNYESKIIYLKNE